MGRLLRLETATHKEGILSPPISRIRGDLGSGLLRTDSKALGWEVWNEFGDGGKSLCFQ